MELNELLKSGSLSKLIESNLKSLSKSNESLKTWLTFKYLRNWKHFLLKFASTTHFTMDSHANSLKITLEVYWMIINHSKSRRTAPFVSLPGHYNNVNNVKILIYSNLLFLGTSFKNFHVMFSSERDLKSTFLS